MRLNYLHLAAAALLLLCIFLIIRQAGENGPQAITTHAAPQPPTSPASAQTAGIPHDSVPDLLTTPTIEGAATPVRSAKNLSGAPALRLADNLPLPAAIIAINNAKKDPAHPIEQPVLDAMQNIVDTFYQELAASVIGGQPTSDNTIVIQDGPLVDQARDHADESYRLLFGDEAYNRMTIDAVIESRLPANAGE